MWTDVLCYNIMCCYGNYGQVVASEEHFYFRLNRNVKTENKKHNKMSF